MNDMLSSELKTPDILIGADIPLDASRFPIRELLDAFRRASVQRPGLRLREAFLCNHRE